MANPETDPIQRFTTLLRHEWAKLDARNQAELDTEDLLDIFWLAQHIQPSSKASASTQESLGSSVIVRQGKEIVSPPSAQNQEPKAAVYPPSPPTESQSGKQPGLGASLPLQVPAANALRSQRDLARALRPLMRKIPSPTQCLFDEEATAIRTAEQQIVVPVLVPAPERWFDLAIVVEDSPSLKLWEDTIAELHTLVEQQGAFRQIRTWRLHEGPGKKIQLSANWRSTPAQQRPRNADVLLDPTSRRIIWLVSDCTSDLWNAASIYKQLQKWGKYSPLVLIHLFPERLWQRTALGIGQAVRLRAVTPGATHAMLTAGATPIYPSIEDEDDDQKTAEPQQFEATCKITLPIISLEPEPLKRWAKVTVGTGDVSVAGFQIDLEQLTSLTHAQVSFPALTPEQRVQQFCATASITAQKLAGLMAAVPVSLPVVHLIQKTLLPQSQQVHVAEVFMGGLLDALPPPPDQPRASIQYYFPEPVREQLVDAVPISKTTRVIDIVSADIADRLGRSDIKTFAALIAILPELRLDQQQSIQHFAEIPLSTLRRLGGDYRTQADRLARYVTPHPPGFSPQGWPPFQEYRYQTATLELEPLQRFEFETATIQQQGQQGFLRRKPKWVITKSPGYGWQRVEDLGNGVLLEMVEVIGGRFQMGSPENEPERYGDEGPQHEVTVNDFFIGKYPVTQAQWRTVASLPPVNQDLEPDPANFKGEKRPVERVSWHDAVEFCARLSKHTGREYSLPTEAEWEYACRSGTTTPFYFGETITTDLANYRGKDWKYEGNTYSGSYNTGPKGVFREETTEVGSFPAN
ncbi:MAG: formylglycine-generating enzyme family protein, partial [Leptolyngbyaceae cyanobacterium bins.59]|nr:formylglycine-generating enzyme family protein [Leptolyngbyaceae cyanobacterium bins.59]